MDDLRFWGKPFEATRHPIIKTDSHGNKQITVADRPVGVDCSVHTEHAQGEGIVAGEGSQAHQCGGNRNVRLFGQLPDLQMGT